MWSIPNNRHPATHQSQQPENVIPKKRPRLTTLALFFVPQQSKGAHMFLPFLAAAAVSTAFTQLGAMSVRIAALTGALNAMVSGAIALTVHAVWMHRKA